MGAISQGGRKSASVYSFRLNSELCRLRQREDLLLTVEKQVPRYSLAHASE